MLKNTAVLFLAVLLFVLSLSDSSNANKETTDPDINMTEEAIEEHLKDFDSSIFTREKYIRSMNHLEKRFECFDKLIADIGKNSNLSGNPTDVDSVLYQIGQVDNEFIMDTYLTASEIKSSRKNSCLVWDIHVIGGINLLTYFEAYGLYKDMRIAELELEVLKLKNADEREKAEAEQITKHAREEFRNFALTHGWAD